jgi:site-specific DNA-methyltransferase (adenine-specific)
VKGLRPWWRRAPQGTLSQLQRGDIVTGDALDLLDAVADGVADIVFLDPPFNLGKRYGDRPPRDDRRDEGEYLGFLEAVIGATTRVLRPGGALFIYHVPKRAVQMCSFMPDDLVLQHWIAIAMKNGFPGRRGLYPAHYALLYLTKGEPQVSHSLGARIAVS